MDTKSLTTTEKPANDKRAPYQQPTLRSYGSIQSMTLARADGKDKDGPGGGGKTAV